MVTPEMMPDANVDLEELPMVGVKEAAKIQAGVTIGGVEGVLLRQSVAPQNGV
ncbi:MAG: hypothetical protein ABIP48_22505 [Planctomycetota bacterium]